MVVTGTVEFSLEECCQFIEASPGRYVFLEVADTGCGMSPEARARAFEPFFTTKPEGRGTGLGLSIVYGICKQNNGLIQVNSEVDAGTVFRIYLPEIESQATVSREAVVEGPYPFRGGGVLIVEDEAVVRSVARRILEGEGYEVMEATDGEEALGFSKSQLSRVRLLLTDVKMPRVGGGEVADRLRQLLPDLRVLFMSGHGEDSLWPDGLHYPATDFIKKPFTVTGLIGAVRELLT